MCNKIGLPVRRRFSHFRDIQEFPEAAQAAALMCHPLLATNPSPARKTHGLLRAHSAPNLQQMSSTMETTPLKGAFHPSVPYCNTMTIAASPIGAC